MKASVKKTVDVVDKVFVTSDGRVLAVDYNSFSNDGGYTIRLGNTGRFPFKDNELSKCRRKFQWFIKELDAVEIVKN